MTKAAADGGKKMNATAPTQQGTQPTTQSAHDRNPYAPFKDATEYFDQLSEGDKLRLLREERFEGELSPYFIPPDGYDERIIDPYNPQIARIPYFHPKRTIADLNWHEFMQYGKPTTMEIFNHVPKCPKADMLRILERDPWATTWIEPDYIMGEGSYFIMIKRTNQDYLDEFLPVEFYIHPEDLPELQPRIDLRRRRGLIRELFELRDIKTAPQKPNEHWSSLGKNF